MPSWNTAKFIGKSIQCVLNQTYENWELIIVDDCSTDNTDEVIKSYLKDGRIRYFKNDKNRGAAVCRNKALQEANGRWIAFLDSDDLWDLDKLEKQVRFMDENNYHFSFTNYREIDDEGRLIGIMWIGPKMIGRVRMMMFNYMGCLTVMYDRNYVGLIQIVDIKKRNDYALWMKVIKKCNAYLLDECLASYRVRKTGSIMNRGKNPFKRMKYNYELWHKSEGITKFVSILLTCVNTLFGATKKIIYRKKVQER